MEDALNNDLSLTLGQSRHSFQLADMLYEFGEN